MSYNILRVFIWNTQILLNSIQVELRKRTLNFLSQIQRIEFQTSQNTKRSKGNRKFGNRDRNLPVSVCVPLPEGKLPVPSHHRDRNLTEIFRSPHIFHLFCWEPWLECLAAKLQPVCSRLSVSPYWENTPRCKDLTRGDAQEIRIYTQNRSAIHTKSKRSPAQGFCCTFKNTNNHKA